MSLVEAMLTVYSDESEDGRIITLAGWLATPSSWRILRPRWRSMLRKHHAKEFHAADLLTTKAEREYTIYRGWSDAQCRSFLDDAIGVLSEDKRMITSLQSIACSFITNTDLMRRHKYTFWKLAFIRLTLLAHDAFPAARGVRFVFDEKEKVKGFVAQAYRDGRKSNAFMRRWTSSSGLY